MKRLGSARLLLNPSVLVQHTSLFFSPAQGCWPRSLIPFLLHPFSLTCIYFSFFLSLTLAFLLPYRCNMSTDDRPFECPHCPKRFREHGNLKTHVRTHTGERPYKCDECDRAFAQRSMLTRHMNTHAKVVGLLMCGQCHMTLPSQAKLDEHLRLHQDEDNLRLDCSYCNKKFRSAITLKNHTEDHVAAGDALRVDLVVAGGKGGKDAKRPLSTLVAAASSLAQLDNSENSNAGLPPTKRGRGNGRVASRHEETAGEEDKNAALADQPRVVAGGGGKGGRAARGRLPSTDLSSLLSESDCDAAHVMPSAGGSGGFAAAIAARRSNANKPQFNVSFDGIPSRVSLPVATPQPGGALLANGYHGYVWLAIPTCQVNSSFT